MPTYFECTHCLQRQDVYLFDPDHAKSCSACGEDMCDKCCEPPDELCDQCARKESMDRRGSRWQ